jgi:crotonobetainyl-CoA:carnitine CoA-transferase CaiB-like acyl-CoA transferase
MTKPLAGLRVADCSWGTAGPRATGLLADYGADVVWVEPPGGDPWRTALPSAVSVFNRGKRSTVLNLRDARDREQLFAIAGAADVFVESWQPGVADELGVGPDTLQARNPSLVYCSISGFGADGPIRDVPGHEALVHALAGTMAEQPGHRDGPIFEALPFASIGAAYLAVIGILAALHRRHDDGWGRHVETSLLDGALAYFSMLWGESDATPPGPTLKSQGSARLITRTFLCGDDRYLGVHTGAVGGFGRLMKVLGLDDRIPPSETGLDMGMLLTAEQVKILDSEIHDIFGSRSCDEWVSLLRDADVCAIEHLQPCEAFDKPQPRHNEMVVTVDDPALGPVEQVAPPARFRGAPTETVRPAPALGAHNDDVAFASTEPFPPRTPEPDRRPLLDGVKILDLGAYYAGPYSSRLLADLGADVIKLEPVFGDPLRGIERPFFSAQAGKRSIAADLKDPELAPAVRALLSWADVVHHNQRPGAAERLGIGFDQAREANPRLIYLYAPGWGSSGPDELRQSFAPMMSGYAGIGFECAGEYNPPIWPAGNEDPGNGLLGAAAILMALLQRRRTGVGQLVENPQLNATLAHMAHAVRAPDGTVIGAGRLDPLQMGFGPFERLYEAADGWVCIVAFTDAQHDALAEITGVDVSDSPYAVGLAIAAALSTRTTAAVLADLRAAGVPAAEPAPRNMHAFMNDPEHRRTGRVAELPHPEKGSVRELAVLVRVSDAEVPDHRLAPALGEHTAEVLETLGYSDDHIEALRMRGAVVAPH